MPPICPCAALSAAFGGHGGQGCVCGGVRCLPGFPWVYGLFGGHSHRHRRTASWSTGRDSFWGRLCRFHRLCLLVCRQQGSRSRGSGCCRFFCFSLFTSVMCRLWRDVGLNGLSMDSWYQRFHTAASGSNFLGNRCAIPHIGHRQPQTYACLG